MRRYAAVIVVVLLCIVIMAVMGIVEIWSPNTLSEDHFLKTAGSFAVLAVLTLVINVITGITGGGGDDTGGKQG